MAIEYTTEIEGDLLCVTSWGSDDNLEESVTYGESLISLCVDNQCSKVLVDESRLTGVLDKVKTYEMVKRLQSLVPYTLSIAYVINPENLEDVSFGVLVAENRGIHVKAFLSKELAYAWLLEQATLED
ncbi:MAG: hypothetical protein U9N50_08345 [Pseudomonadota bacterium]|nr:hypothetical protein [Pseudomonadota bacterium]